MIFDACTFGEELDILEIRISEMYPVCDQIFIIESNRTQTRLEKPFNFELNKERYSQWLDKITYYKVLDFEPAKHDFCWSHEKFQRNCITIPITKFIEDNHISPYDVFVNFGDVDEIVNGELLKSAVENYKEPVSFNHIFGSYFLNFRARRNWFGSVLVKFYDLSYYSPQGYREVKDHLIHVEDVNLPSWHFSSVGHPIFDFNWHKWQTRIEPRAKIPESLKEQTRQQFNKCVFEDKHFFYCDQPNRRDIPLEQFSVDFLPNYIKENFSKYEHLMIL